MPPPRQRVLFLAEAVTLSHVARPSVLARTLDPARYEIVFACDEAHAGFLGRHDFTFVPLKSLVAGKDLERVSLLKEELFSFDTLDRYINEDLRLFDRWRPDVVVGDMRQSLVVSARLARLPVITIQNCHWHPRSPIVIESPVRMSHPLVPPPVSAMMQDVLVNVLFSFGATYHNMLSVRYGLPPVGRDMRDVLSYGDYLAFPDIVEWSRLPATPANAAFVGPLLWAPPVPLPAWWDQLPDSGPLVYLCLGSSGQPRLLHQIIRLLAARRVTVVVATAARKQLDQLPPGVFVADYLDGGAVAERAALTICNGGSMSGPQALAKGCPILGLVSNSDQAAFMRNIEGTSAGLSLAESAITDDSLGSAIDRLLRDDVHRLAARRLADAIRRVDTAAEFNRLLARALPAAPKPMPAATAVPVGAGR